MAPSPTTFQRIIASPFATDSCLYAWGKRSTAGLASDATKWCMKDGWRLSKRQSPTRTSSPCCGPTRRSAASRPHAWEGLYLASPTHYTTPHLALPSHTLFLGHPHTLFIPLIILTQCPVALSSVKRDLTALLTPKTRPVLATYKVLDHRSRAIRTCQRFLSQYGYHCLDGKVAFR